MSTLITNGTIITAVDERRADILIDGETIKQIGQDLDAGAAEVVDASGMLVMPGGVDMHTHLELDLGGTVTTDDFFTGHRAAAFGGTTSHIDFPYQPFGGTLSDALEQWHAKAEGKASIDYGFHLVVVELNDTTIEEIPRLVEQGVTSLKLFMGTMFMVDDATLFRTMQIVREHGMLVMVHAENGHVIDQLTRKLLAEGKGDPIYHNYSRPALAEGEATGRAIALAGIADAPLYVVHMTCREALQQLEIGRKRGLKVMGETCPSYLFLTEEDVAQPDFEGAKYVCTPPVRQAEDNQALWDALENGLLQVVSTDHVPFWFEGGKEGRKAGKELGKGDFSKIPHGMPGIEDRMMVMWHHGVSKGRFDAQRFVQLMCTNPAKSFGMYPKKGELAVGSDADILIWDPNKEHTISAETHHMNTDYNIFEGMTVRGKPARVFLRGKLIVDGDEWLQERGQGQFIRREPYAEIL